MMMVKEPNLSEDILPALRCPVICFPKHYKKDFLACVSQMANNYIQLHLHAQVKKTWTRCRTVWAVMVHFGTGTVQHSVLDIIAMSVAGHDLRHILDSIHDGSPDSSNQREAGPVSSTEGQGPAGLRSQQQSTAIITAVKEALMYAVKQMVRYRSEKRPLEHAYNGRALFWVSMRSVISIARLTTLRPATSSLR